MRLPLEAKLPVWKETGYQPTEAALPFHAAMAKVEIVSGGERGGKSRSAGEDLLPYTILTPETFGRGEPFLHYGLIAQEFDDTREEFEYLVDGLSKLGMIKPGSLAKPDQGRWKVKTKTGTLIDTWSAKDPLRIRRVFFHGALICEPGRLAHDAFTRVLGRVSQTGGWVNAVGTFEGSVGWYPEYYTMGQADNTRGVVSFTLPSWANPHAYPGGRDDPEIKFLEENYKPDTFLERVGAVPAPPRGLVFKLFKNHLHVSSECTYLPGLPVGLAIDPGRAHAYAVEAVQFSSDDVCRIFDEPVYHTGLTNMMAIRICQGKPWWKDVTYIVMDIAGRQRTANHEQSCAEIWAAETGLPVYTNRVGIEDGIERVDSFLMLDPVTEQPRMQVNPVCQGLICEMGAGPQSPHVDVGGPYVYPTDNDGNARSDRPVDKFNDACKALGYLLIYEYGYVRKPAKSRAPRSAYGAWQGEESHVASVNR